VHDPSESRRAFHSCIVTIAQAQTPDISEIRRQGMDLYNQNKMVDAAPLLEQVVQANPSDTVALERLAFSLMVSSSAVQNPEEQKKVRLRARAFALRARDLGDNSNLLGMVLGSIPADGGLPRGFSEKSEVDAVMKEGEAAFARGDFARALAAYAHALELDPRQYEAALFTGDVYFKQNQMEKAGEWFARAVEIDENRETAHRYWGDALLRSGNTVGARTKFIDAVIAEPYNRKRMGRPEPMGTNEPHHLSASTRRCSAAGPGDRLVGRVWQKLARSGSRAPSLRKPFRRRIGTDTALPKKRRHSEWLRRLQQLR
jgi:tetratricopeptide (TPR) repeat protein